MKKCSKCGEDKEFMYFSKEKRAKSGYRSSCKACDSLKFKNWEKNKKIHRKEYRKANEASNNARSAMQRAEKHKTVPKWLNDEHKREIVDIYTDCSDLQWLSEEKLEVDHIIPFRGENVTGLHVPWNLQIITKSENRQKRNRLE